MFCIFTFVIHKHQKGGEGKGIGAKEFKNPERRIMFMYLAQKRARERECKYLEVRYRNLTPSVRSNAQILHTGSLNQVSVMDLHNVKQMKVPPYH